jgi:hypothetical protein
MAAHQVINAARTFPPVIPTPEVTFHIPPTRNVPGDARVQVLLSHPRAYAKAAQSLPGFVVWICDYVAGYGLTIDDAWADALYVITNDLLTHERLAPVQ